MIHIHHPRPRDGIPTRAECMLCEDTWVADPALNPAQVLEDLSRFVAVHTRGNTSPGSHLPEAGVPTVTLSLAT